MDHSSYRDSDGFNGQGYFQENHQHYEQPSTDNWHNSDGIYDTASFESDPDPADELTASGLSTPRLSDEDSFEFKKPVVKRATSINNYRSKSPVSASKGVNIKKGILKNSNFAPKIIEMNNYSNAGIEVSYKDTCINNDEISVGNLFCAKSHFDTSEEIIFDYVTPNFEDDFSEPSPQRNNNTVERKELNIEKYAKNSRFDQLKTVTRSQSKKNFRILQTNMSTEKPRAEAQIRKVNRDPFIEVPFQNEIIETPVKNKLSNRRISHHTDTQDRHLDSNKRRRYSLARDKKNIDTIFNQLKKTEDEDIPESNEDSVRHSSQVYLKYRALFEEKDTEHHKSRERPNDLHNYRTTTIE